LEFLKLSNFSCKVIIAAVWTEGQVV